MVGVIGTSSVPTLTILTHTCSTGGVSVSCILTHAVPVPSVTNKILVLELIRLRARATNVESAVVSALITVKTLEQRA